MRRGQRDAEFEAYVAAARPRLRRLAYSLCGDWHAADDVVQTALAKLYVAWPRVREDTRMAYARRVVVNECLSHLRRHRPETPTETLPDHAVDAPEPGTDLGETLASLPPRQRAIIALRFLDDLPVTEVGRLLGIADGTVKSQTNRALATLRRHLPDLVLEETR